MGLAASFVLGYHGCDPRTAGKLLGGKPFKHSKNEYDWLGHGVYFWEANPRRALDWARNWGVRQPRAIGAVIELGNCLDLFSAAGIEAVREAYDSLRRTLHRAGLPLPRNSSGPDRLRRTLDCAVIEHLCLAIKPSYDTVRGLFREGPPIYPSAGFYSKTHIQLCVRNPACIKGVFRAAPDQPA